MEPIFLRGVRLLLLSLWSASIIVSIEHPEDFVNLLAGTFTDGQRFSTGNTLPLIGYPFGFNHWAPQTIDEHPDSGSWWFRGNDHVLTWLRCTHQPSPWIGDWGYFTFTPQLGDPNRNPEHFWEPRGAIIKPYLYDATVAPYGMRIQLVPTMHGAILQVTFQPQNKHMDKRVCFTSARFTQHSVHPKPFIAGYADQVHHDRMLITNFRLHILAESADAEGTEDQPDMTCFRFRSDANVVSVRMATSLISREQASVNLARELPESKSFDDMVAVARGVWNRLLKRVDVIDPGEISAYSFKHTTVFYTGLVRALSFPRRLDEVDANGETVHYSPYDPSGRTFSGPLVTDNGFWDTFRTVYPMMSLLYPDLLGPIIQGWLNAFVEGGWLPSWASPGYRNCMVGTFADVVVADAIVKGVPGFDLDLARRALLKDAFEIPPPFAGNAVGKEGLLEYMSRGFVSIQQPQAAGDQISRTLDFGFADFSTAEAFKVLAKRSEFVGIKSELLQKADVLHNRAIRAPTLLFDKQSGLMVAKSSNGQSFPYFSNIEWGMGYTEGNAWHHSFPPYAIDTMISLYGSRAKYLEKLKQVLTTPGDFRPGSYGQVIHEMTEARALAMGQYSHNNQPCHHILYLFALLGDRATTEIGVRSVMDRGYGVDFYAGDEDNGEMGAWFVLSALGLYVTTPGTLDYVLGSPVFPHVRITRANNSTLDILAPGTRPGVVKVTRVILNDIPVEGCVVKDNVLQLSGTTLRFVMEGEADLVRNTQSPVVKTHLRHETRPAQSTSISLQSLDFNNSGNAMNALQAELQHRIAIQEEMSHRISYLLEKNAEQGTKASGCSYYTSRLIYAAALMLVAVFATAYFAFGWGGRSPQFRRLFVNLKAESHLV